MALIHRTSYEIIQTLNDGLIHDDYFQVDDLIAIPVAELCKKGYVTTESCAGHPFPNLYHIDTSVDLENAVDFDELASPATNNSPRENNHQFTLRTYKFRMSYIVFEEPIPEAIGIPEGWHYDEDGQMLYTRYKKSDSPYAFIKKQNEKIDSLLVWANDI